MGHFFPTPGAILVWAFQLAAFVPARDAIVYSTVECCMILKIQFISLPLGKRQTKLTLKNCKIYFSNAKDILITPATIIYSRQL